ncbi:MAG TPA: hypothetical protein VI432_02450 [Candidatus Paceibacterota bacterium]
MVDFEVLPWEVKEGRVTEIRVLHLGLKEAVRLRPKEPIAPDELSSLKSAVKAFFEAREAFVGDKPPVIEDATTECLQRLASKRAPAQGTNGASHSLVSRDPGDQLVEVSDHVWSKMPPFVQNRDGLRTSVTRRDLQTVIDVLPSVNETTVLKDLGEKSGISAPKLRLIVGVLAQSEIVSVHEVNPKLIKVTTLEKPNMLADHSGIPVIESDDPGLARAMASMREGQNVLLGTMS